MKQMETTKTVGRLATQGITLPVKVQLTQVTVEMHLWSSSSTAAPVVVCETLPGHQHELCIMASKDDLPVIMASLCRDVLPRRCVYGTRPVSAHPLSAIECLMSVHVGSQDYG